MCGYQADVFKLKAEMGLKLAAALKDNVALQHELTSVKAFVDELLQSMAGKWMGGNSEQLVQQPAQWQQPTQSARRCLLPSP